MKLLLFCFFCILNFISQVNGNFKRNKRQVLTFNGPQEKFAWPDNTVSYFLDDDSFDYRVQQSLYRAMDHISNHTCMKFSTKRAKYMIRIQSKDKGGCYAVIGKVERNQPLNLGYSCNTVGIAAHELIHALGFIHTHQRKDRDQFLKFDLLPERSESDYIKDQYRIFKNQALLVPYDYGSIMQYDDRDLEYEPYEKDYLYTLGSEIFAFYDYKMINKYYECRCPEDTKLDCKNNGYPNPSNCEECNCPLGYGGKDCGERPNPGESLKASRNWQDFTIQLDAGYRKLENGKRSQQIDFVFNYTWITAPGNKTIEVEIREFSGVKCDFGCKLGGIEVKIHEDNRMTSPRFCCENQKRVYRSTNNPTVIMAFNSAGLDEYYMSYRYVD